MGRAVYSEGLVDSRSKEEFDAVLKKIDDIWDSSQRGSQFYHFFWQYQAIVIKYYKRGYIIEAAGLSSPLSIKKKKIQLTWNWNAELKRKVNYKESQWPEFNSHMQQLVESQRDEIIRAISGRSQYHLLPEFHHRTNPVNEWTKIQTEQHQKTVFIFTRHNYVQSHLYCQAKTQKWLAARHCYHCEYMEDSGIGVIPIVTTNAMWAKAKHLLADNCITAAPGKDKKGRMVLLYSFAILTLCKARECLQ